MWQYLAVSAFAAFLFVMGVYVFYLFSIFWRGVRKKEYLDKIESIEKLSIELPPVSVIVNTFNEARVIRRKIEDVSHWSYPTDKVEVLVVDDCSTDGTASIAQKAFADFKVMGKVLKTSRRIGLNESLNFAFANASNCVVCVTDSDVVLDQDALRKAVLVLECFEGVGGVTGKVMPVTSVANVASSSEGNYRSFYDTSMLSESSYHSAFPGNGPLIVFNESIVTPFIPTTYGSTDANIAMNVVKCGRRFLYNPNALIYEPVPETVSQQKLQKVRRAKRLIQVFLHNSDVFGNKRYGKFGTVLFPIKFLVHVVCPLLLLLSAILFSLSIVFSDFFVFQAVSVIFILASLLVLLLFKRIRKFVVSFVLHQAYLVIGLFSAFRKSVFWKTIDRK
jgi:biofilm PGA synthesis N-glycosyltransferase PgaC